MRNALQYCSIVTSWLPRVGCATLSTAACYSISYRSIQTLPCRCSSYIVLGIDPSGWFRQIHALNHIELGIIPILGKMADNNSGVLVLSQGVGYGIVVGIGVFFALMM